VREVLASGGTFFLFYETPSAGRVGEVATRIAKALRANGFTEPETLTPAPELLCCVSRVCAS
jgi:hypothetical protein